MQRAYGGAENESKKSFSVSEPALSVVEGYLCGETFFTIREAPQYSTDSISTKLFSVLGACPERSRRVFSVVKPEEQPCF